MPNHHIIITASNSSSGTLTLSDRGRRTWVKGRDNVIWHIRAGSGVASITKIVTKPDSPQIFSVLPQQQGEIWTGTIRRIVNPCTEWEYSIFWKSTDGTGPHEYDPKISVKPADVNFFKILTIILPAIFSVIFATRFFKRKRKSNIKED